MKSVIFLTRPINGNGPSVAGVKNITDFTDLTDLEEESTMQKGKKCKGCGYPVTWHEQRLQYGRLIECGLTPQAAGELMPRCQRCVATHLREQGLRAPVRHRPARLRG